MVRSYLRHEPTQAFGVICSNTARSILDADGKVAYVPALEDVLVWDVRKGEQVRSDGGKEARRRDSADLKAVCPPPCAARYVARSGSPLASDGARSLSCKYLLAPLCSRL